MHLGGHAHNPINTNTDSPNTNFIKWNITMKTSTKKRKEMYDHVTGHTYENTRYGTPHNELYRQMRNELLASVINEQINGNSQANLLEIGCGTGLTLAYLTKRLGKYELYGLDFSHTMLEQANQKVDTSEEQFNLVQGDSFELPFRDNSFDVVYNTRFIHQFTHNNKISIYKEMMRVLKPGGIVISEFYNRHHRWFLYLRGTRNYPVDEQCPTQDEIREINGDSYTKLPIRMVGLRFIHNLFGANVLRAITPLAGKPFIKFLLEEYFVVTKKSPT